MAAKVVHFDVTYIFGTIVYLKHYFLGYMYGKF